jgi:circadian clock protein KaiC
VQQIIYTNASPKCKALYLTTLSEPSIKMLHYLQKFTFFDAEKVGREVIYLDIGEVIRNKGLENAIAVIIKHVQEYKPGIVGIDSFKAIHDMARDPVEARKFGFDLAVRLTTWAITAFFVGEYSQPEIEREPIFAIADGILCLHNKQEGLSYQRYVDVIKLRGEEYFNGWHPFTIDPTGLTVYPRIKTPESFPNYHAVSESVSTGLPDLDGLIDGGLPRGSATMIAGGAGTGKTLLGLHFLTSGAAQGEPGVIVTFQENPTQMREIVRSSFGWNLEHLEQQGLLAYLYTSPVEIQPDIHATRVREAVEKIGARRVLIDSIKDIEIATPDKVRFKDYIYSMVNYFKTRGITIILTNEIPEIFGDFQLSEYGVSFIADNVILLRYVEVGGRMEHAISIMKVRGSRHSRDIRRFEITGSGIRIGGIFDRMSGILTGTPSMNDDSRYLHLPLRSRYVCDALRQVGLATIEKLSQVTGLSEDDVRCEFQHLQKRGLVEAVTDEEGTEFFELCSWS